jgi:hypothetical protein
MLGRAGAAVIPVLNDWNDDSQPVAIVHARCRHANKEVLAFRAFMASILPPDMTRRFKRTIHRVTQARASASEAIVLKESVERNSYV